MSIGTVITGGYGSFGSPSFVVTDGYGGYGAVAPAPAKKPTGGGGSSEGYRGGLSAPKRLYDSSDVAKAKYELEEAIAEIEAEKDRKKKNKLKAEAVRVAELAYIEAYQAGDLEVGDSKLFDAYTAVKGLPIGSEIDFEKFANRIGNLRDLAQLIDMRANERAEDEFISILLLSI